MTPRDSNPWATTPGIADLNPPAVRTIWGQSYGDPFATANPVTPTPAGLADRLGVHREFLVWAAVFIAAPGVAGCTVTTEFGFWPGLATLIILAMFVGGVAWLTRHTPRRQP